MVTFNGVNADRVGERAEDVTGPVSTFPVIQWLSPEADSRLKGRAILCEVRGVHSSVEIQRTGVSSRRPVDETRYRDREVPKHVIVTIVGAVSLERSCIPGPITKDPIHDAWKSRRD